MSLDRVFDIAIVDTVARVNRSSTMFVQWVPYQISFILMVSPCGDGRRDLIYCAVIWKVFSDFQCLFSREYSMILLIHSTKISMSIFWRCVRCCIHIEKDTCIMHIIIVLQMFLSREKIISSLTDWHYTIISVLSAWMMVSELSLNSMAAIFSVFLGNLTISRCV